MDPYLERIINYLINNLNDEKEARFIFDSHAALIVASITPKSIVFQLLRNLFKVQFIFIFLMIYDAQTH